jgi:hypothetical protein
MHPRFFVVIGLVSVLSACGGGKDPMADLCAKEAERVLTGQVYRLDEGQLAGSKTAGANGAQAYKGEIILKPGTSGEQKQTFDCLVEPANGDAPPRVIRFGFNVEGSGLTN